MVLLHRNETSEAATAEANDPYDPTVEKDLEKARAMESSLWEAEALQQHHLYPVAVLAKALQTESSTMTGPSAPSLEVRDFIEHNYTDLMDAELKRREKKDASALAYKEPTFLITKNSILDNCFGF